MNRWFSRGLIVLILASLLGSGLTALASPPSQDQAITVTLYDGASQGLLSYEARGRGVASGAMIDLTVTNLSGKPLDVLIPPATRFIPTEPPAETSSLLPPGARLRVLPGADENPLLRPLLQGGGQGGAAIGMRMSMPGGGSSYPKGIGRPHRQTQYPTQTITLEAYCLNAHLDNPSASTLFTALPPENDDISRLIQAYNARSGGVSVVAMQIAVWILTDDVDLAFLEQVGYSPTDADLRDALLLLQEAGIDISDKQLGQIELPPAPTPTPMFTPGQATTARLRGSVVNEAREPVEDALVLVAAIGPERTRRSFDVTSERGRFETLLQLTETDNVIFTVRISGHEIGELEMPGADALNLAAQGGELLLIVSGGTPVPTSTPIPIPEGGATGGTPLTGPLFAARVTQGGANIRGEANTSSAVAGTLACGGAVAALDAQLVDSDGYTWYHLAAGGWLRSDVVRVFGSQAEAEAAAANSQAACAPSTATPAPAQNTGGETGGSGGSGGESGGQSGGSSDGQSGGGEVAPPPPPPTTNYNVTITNNASCTISGSLGPAGYSVGSGGSTTISVPQGTHGFSGSGDCGEVAPATYTIDGDATITIG